MRLKVHASYMNLQGTHFFPDGSRLTMNFEGGCPQGDGIMTEIRAGTMSVAMFESRISCDCTYYDVNYEAGAGIPLKDGALPLSKSEGNPEPHDVVRMPFVGCSVGAPQQIPVNILCLLACSLRALHWCLGAPARRENLALLKNIRWRRCRRF